MSAGVLAMLLGLFAVPIALLWMGHQFRKKSPQVRGAFWGGVIGHSVAALLATAAGLWSPANWSATDNVRGFLGFWAMLAVGVTGMVLGAWLGGRGARE